jgi:hypothetical protein
MESINSFSSGMNSDQSKTILNKETYLQALNFRGLSELGSSNGSLVNIKGNECKLTFPDLQPVFKIEVIQAESDTANPTDITINGVTDSIDILNTTTGFDLFTFITSKFSNCYQYTGTTVATKTFAVAYEDNYIVIYNQPVYQNCTTVASIAPTIVLTPDEDDGTRALLYFINQNAANSLTQNTAKPYVAGCPSSLVKPIGSTFILNDIYILTATDNPTYGPAGAPNEIPSNDELQFGGAIWKLNIDDISKQHTLTLVYSNNLDFTKYHPIPPSAITGRYESIDIKRIYWSDNYNKIRTINTEAPQLMALNPTILSIMPLVEYTQGILNSIGIGSLPAGCYQLAYRLSKVLGSVTNFSELSNPVYLTTSPESNAFHLYEGGLGATGKNITWKLDNLDLNFDQIESIIIYRSSDSSIPTITSLGVQTISSTMNIVYSDPNATTNSEITLDEFLLFNGTFTHAKTCDTKDNRLFWGNVRAPRKDLELYDARAFRANDAGEIRLVNNADGGAPYTFSQAKALAQTEDTINEYYNSNTGDYSTNACYLKPTDLTKLGGEGANISYEFGTYILSTDDQAGPQGEDNWDLYINHVGSPYRGSITESSPITNSNLVYSYPQNGKFAALKQPERTSILKGFQHEEIYRFGIQFFDKEGNPYFTKWIGDIKMPSYGDKNDNPGGSVNDFRLSYQGAFNDIISQALYIKFTVDISFIQDLIGGYQIVRVKREGTNKTIWGVGLINPMISYDGTDGGGTASLPAGFESEFTNFTMPPVFGPVPFPRRYYKPYPSQDSVETLNISYDNSSNPNFARFKTFDCWDFDLGNRPSFANTDKLFIRSRLESVNYRNSAGGYRQWFDKDYGTTAGQEVPTDAASIDNGTTPPFFSSLGSNNDNSHQPFFIFKLVDNFLHTDYTQFVTSGTNKFNYNLVHAEYIPGNDSITWSGYSINNKGLDNPIAPATTTGSPAGGKQTLFLVVSNNLPNTKASLFTSDNDAAFNYNCTDTSNPFYKLLALYYKPNSSLYGGATYVARTNNEYIPCGEYVPTMQNGSFTIPSGIKTLMTFGGDVFTVTYDFQKTFKPLSGGATYFRFDYNSSGTVLNLLSAEARFSTSFFVPCTSISNQELRLGNHPNKSITAEAGYEEDDYSYNTYNNAENDVKTYFPKPLNFQTSEEWINRIYWSEVKFNNEIQDSWSVYLTDSFYDVEGNYGGINALVSLKENMYYLQERGVGSLMINPVSLINDQMGQPIKLGGSASNSPVIQKHYYKSIDTGTFHQWSVYRSQSTITFVDARHKKIYLFNGESVSPISDIKGQRNFVIKRLHNELLKFDNPVINKGVLTTYDYYHNEFLYTFNNDLEGDTINNENLTLAYSEVLNAFTGMYSFTPNLYINSNKYLISTKNSNVGPYYPSNKLWFHNYGAYGSFYNTVYPSTLKLLINDNPLYTKVFDNMTIESEAIDDNVEWNDDLNIYPGSPTNPSYPDDVNIKDSTFQEVRCYNQYQNTDWTTLTIAPPNNNIRKVEQGFNLQLPRNKFDYDTYNPSTYSIFDPSKLTKTTFGERLRDKWLIADFKYDNLLGLRFIIHNIKTLLRISDR